MGCPHHPRPFEFTRSSTFTVDGYVVKKSEADFNDDLLTLHLSRQIHIIVSAMLDNGSK